MSVWLGFNLDLGVNKIMPTFHYPYSNSKAQRWGNKCSGDSGSLAWSYLFLKHVLVQVRLIQNTQKTPYLDSGPMMCTSVARSPFIGQVPTVCNRCPAYYIYQRGRDCQCIIMTPENQRDWLTPRLGNCGASIGGCTEVMMTTWGIQIFPSAMCRRKKRGLPRS